MHEPSLLIAALGDNIKQQGSKWVARCPTHNDKDFAMYVKPRVQGGYNITCYACGANGLDTYRNLGLDLDELFGKALERDEGFLPSDIKKSYDDECYFVSFFEASTIKPTLKDRRRYRLAKARKQGIEDKFSIKV